MKFLPIPGYSVYTHFTPPFLITYIDPIKILFSIHLLNLINILQWYTEINRKQMRICSSNITAFVSVRDFNAQFLWLDGRDICSLCIFYIVNFQ